MTLALASALAWAQEQETVQQQSGEAKASTLPTVTVQDSATTPAPIEDWRSMERTTDKDLKDILADQVGVQFGGGNGVSQHWTIRGMGADQINLVIDDASSDVQIFHHQGRYFMDPALVKIIGIEKGTGSASSGIGATSGKIEATTVDALDLLREGQNVGFRLNGGLASSKDAGWDTGFSVYGRSGKVDGLFAANRTHSDDYKDGRGDKIGHSALDMRSFLAKAGVSITDDSRFVIGHRREQEYGIRNLREEFFFNTDNDQPSYKERTIDTTTVSLKGRTPGFVDTYDINFSHIGNEQDDGHGKNVTKVDTNVANVRLSSAILGQHRLKYGLNWREQEAGSSSQRNAGLRKQKKTDTGVYVEGIWRFAPITLTTGLRYDHFELKSNQVGGKSVSDGKLNPSIGIIYDVNDELSLSASHNRATRSPRFYEAMLASTPLIYADNLKAENARNTEIGLDWSRGGFAVNAAYFWQTIKDMQTFTGMNCTGRSCEYQYVDNGSTLKNNGYEINASYRQGGLTGRIGVAYSKPKLNGATYDSVATSIPMGRQWVTSLAYRIPERALEFGWRGRYAQKGSYLDSTRGGGEAVNRSGYGVHDIFLNWQPLCDERLNVNFSVTNLFDKYYRSHSQRSGTSALAEPGRSFRVRVNYRF